RSRGASRPHRAFGEPNGMGARYRQRHKSPRLCSPGGAPLAMPDAEVPSDEPIERRAEDPVRQRNLGRRTRADRHAGVYVKLVKKVPKAMAGITQYEGTHYSSAHHAEDREHRDSAGFEWPSSFIAEIGGERQIEAGNRDEEEAEESLLGVWREHLLGDRHAPGRRHQPDAQVQDDDHGQRHACLPFSMSLRGTFQAKFELTLYLPRASAVALMAAPSRKTRTSRRCCGTSWSSPHRSSTGSLDQLVRPVEKRLGDLQ